MNTNPKLAALVFYLIQINEIKLLNLKSNWASLIGIVTSLWAGWLSNQGYIPLYRVQLWDPFIFLSTV
jgi:hypothetical protein